MDWVGSVEISEVRIMWSDTRTDFLEDAFAVLLGYLWLLSGFVPIASSGLRSLGKRLILR